MKSLLPIAFLLSSFFCSAQNLYLFTGTYTGSGSKGIYVYRFNILTGKATWVSNTDSVANPSYVIISNNGNFVYAVNETNGINPGKVSAFSFNKNKGTLKLLNSEFTGGDDPCHLSISKDSKWLLAANYTGGSVSVFPLNKNGSLNPYTQLKQDSGKSINKERQEKAHVHAAVFSPDEAYIFTPDLGTDKLMIYKFNSLSLQPLTASSPPYVKAIPGSGPRHFIFHPNKKFAYLINELSGSVTTYIYDKGKLAEVQQSITHPKGYKGIPGSAEIIISPDGKFLYASNRGDENTITIFSINSLTGKLKVKGYQSTLGKTPRNFIIDPTGTYLLVANQETDNIVIFKRDSKTGFLKETKEQIHVPKPVCLQMIEIKK
ncbi:MAG: lactonase family protein [Ginsengibacter sp.]